MKVLTLSHQTYSFVFCIERTNRNHSQKLYLQRCSWFLQAHRRGFVPRFNEAGLINKRKVSQTYTIFLFACFCILFLHSICIICPFFLSLSLSLCTHKSSGTCIICSQLLHQLDSLESCQQLWTELHSVLCSSPLNPTDGITGSWPASHSPIAVPRMVGKASMYD